jgi:phosphonate transport system substrate-binding protein
MLLRKLFTMTGIGLGLFALALPVNAELVLGVHPFKPPAKLIESFSPLANYLSEKLGEPVKLVIARDYQAHIEAVGNNHVDIGYFGPVPYLKLHDAFGARPLLVRQVINGSPTFQGRIFVAAASPIKSLTELQGKRFAFGDAHSTMSHLVPRYMLLQAGVTADKLASYSFVGDHVNVALGVLAGDFDAGATKEDVFLQYEKRGLRSIATSMPLSDHVFVANNKLPEKKVQKLRTLLLQLHTEPRGSLILQAITPGVTQLVPVQDSDYDNLRQLLSKLKLTGVQY